MTNRTFEKVGIASVMGKSVGAQQFAAGPTALTGRALSSHVRRQLSIAVLSFKRIDRGSQSSQNCSIL